MSPQHPTSRRSMLTLASVFRNSGCFSRVEVDDSPGLAGRHTFTFTPARSDYREVINSLLWKMGLKGRGGDEEADPAAWEVHTPAGVRLFTYGSDFGAVEP